MLDPTPIIETLVEVFQSIPALVSAIGSPDNIQGHHDYYGLEPALDKAIYEMSAPGILICFESQVVGNPGSMELFRYHFSAYIRVGSQAGQANPISHATIWTLMMNSGPVQNYDGLSQGPNIRAVRIHPNLFPMNPPTNVRVIDTERMDYRIGTMVFTEQGDTF